MRDEPSLPAPDGTTPPPASGAMFTALSFQELLALLEEFERADASPTQPAPRPLGEPSDTES